MTKKYLYTLLIISIIIINMGCEKIKSYQDWEKATKENTIEAYNNFLTKHPESKYNEIAKQKIEEMEFNKVSTENTLEAYKSFLIKYPKGQFSETAKQKLKEFEEIEWQNAEKTNTVEAYRAYLSKYPENERFASFSGTINEIVMVYKNTWVTQIKLNEKPDFKFFVDDFKDVKKYSLVNDNRKTYNIGKNTLTDGAIENNNKMVGVKVKLVCKVSETNEYEIIDLQNTDNNNK
jgi:hypothetical protein